MRNPVTLALLPLLALGLSLSLTARAKPVNFPDEDPAFTVELPKNWESEVLPPDNLKLTTGTGKDTIMVLFSSAEEVTDDPTARVYLPAFAEAMATTFEIKDAKASAPAAEIPLNGKVKAVAQEYQGKTASGTDCVLTTAIFSADGKTYYSMVIMGTKARTTATNADQTAIMESITPK